MAKVLISMQEDFLQKVDEVAETEQRSRSELIREALRSYMKRQNNDNAVSNADLLKSLLLG